MNHPLKILAYFSIIMADLELLVMVENIKHRKVIRRLARGRIPWRSKTLTFVFLVIMNTAGALPDIIKIGERWPRKVLWLSVPWFL